MKLVPRIPVYFYEEESGNEPVLDWIKSLDRADRKKLGDDIKVVQGSWPAGMPLVKPLGRGLWEIRTRLDNRIARIIFIIKAQKIILLHGFIKKTQKTPPQDLELAIKRSKRTKY